MSMSKLFIIAGLVFLAIGVVLTLFPGALGWFGRLPGDIRIENDNTRFHFPLVSMLLISVVASIIINIINRL